MKLIQFSATMLLLLFASTLTLNAQNWGKGTKGTGEIVSKEFNLDNINRIALGISGNLILTQGSSQSVRIEAQSNIMDLINTTVKRNEWDIKFTEKVSKHESITIYVTMETLKELSLGGSGNITCTNRFKNLDDVDISLGGSGNITMDLIARDLDVSLGGSGHVNLDGTCNDLEISLAGSGNINAMDLSSKNCEISIAGSGDVEVSVKNNLEVSMVGSGDVRYTGDPSVETSIVGSGSVRKDRGE